MMKSNKCQNCETERRLIYKAGYCKKCYRWAMQLKRSKSASSSENESHVNFSQIQAQIALKELAWREEPFVRGVCHPLRLESMFHAVSAECRSEIGFSLSDILHNMSEQDRFRCYKILLAIIENTPRYAPVLHTFMSSIKGVYMQEWSNRLRDASEKDREERRRLDKGPHKVN